jgi:hypothetical protein
MASTGTLSKIAANSLVRNSSRRILAFQILHFFTYSIIFLYLYVIEINGNLLNSVHHREDRMLSFSPVVGTGTLPPPHPPASVPPRFGSGERGTLACGRGGGGSQFRRGDILYTVLLRGGTLCLYVLCGKHPMETPFMGGGGQNWTGSPPPHTTCSQ